VPELRGVKMVRTRARQALIVVVAVVALLVTLAVPTPHDHVGKPGSVCHFCNAAQPATLATTAVLVGPARQMQSVLAEAEQHRLENTIRSLRIPRAPPV